MINGIEVVARRDRQRIIVGDSCNVEMRLRLHERASAISNACAVFVSCRWLKLPV